MTQLFHRACVGVRRCAPKMYWAHSLRRGRRERRCRLRWRPLRRLRRTWTCLWDCPLMAHR